jgi:tetratricopeptide (TPR) repeat protein
MEDIGKNNVNKQSKEDDEVELSATEKLIQLNKLGGLFLAGGGNTKAKSIFEKTIKFYNEMILKKEIPNFFYGNMFCNYAKCLSVEKDFDNAEIYYKKVLDEHPFKNTLLEFKEQINELFKIDLNDIYTIKQYSEQDIENGIKELLKVYSLDANNKLLFDFKSKYYMKSSLNSISVYADSLVNLAVIFQIKYKETLTSFNMFILALLCEPENTVGNIDLNGFLRENNFKDLSDKFILHRILYDLKADSLLINQVNQLSINQTTVNGFKNKSKF